MTSNVKCYFQSVLRFKHFRNIVTDLTDNMGSLAVLLYSSSLLRLRNICVLPILDNVLVCRVSENLVILNSFKMLYFLFFLFFPFLLIHAPPPRLPQRLNWQLTCCSLQPRHSCRFSYTFLQMSKGGLIHASCRVLFCVETSHHIYAPYFVCKNTKNLSRRKQLRRYKRDQYSFAW